MEPNLPNSIHENFMAFIRHGERADFATVKDESEYVIDPADNNRDDPPLTKKGMDQALKTGQFIKKVIENNKLKVSKIII